MDGISLTRKDIFLMIEDHGTAKVSEKVERWRVTGDISMSDHRMIRFEIELEKLQIILRRNPRVTDWEKYRNNLGGPEGDQVYRILSPE
ncbi:hypothetical protein NQ317_018864 [Molorchus minor]|uniref:Uncharacterized protein n=1 Tax=Molorchus minor TaxID=1323400 RepID=A0ABQ9IWY9_9CUCU|nr:hypothetical protein NQ317_018864 [Molorchus minor]